MAKRLDGAALHPLTLDPAAPTDDLDWLGRAVGSARVVAVGESAHYNAESYLLRHRLLRYLVERHGFTAYATESGAVEAHQVDTWVRAGQGSLGDVLANGTTSLMGPWREMRELVAWLRAHNRTAARPVGFHGIDLPGSMVSLLPGLDAVAGYLAEADPGYRMDAGLRDTAAAYAAPSAFSAPAALAAYAGLAADRRDALTAGLAELAVRLTARRLDHVARTGAEAYERAVRAMAVTAALDLLHRSLLRGDQQSVAIGRDAAIADTVEAILGRADRIVLAAHNGHVQRVPVTLPGTEPAATAGMHLADRLGADYVVLGTTTGGGRTLNTGPDFYRGALFTDLPPATDSGTLDGLMAASHDGPFAVDLRDLSPADAAAMGAVTRQRLGTVDVPQRPLDAYDVVVHLPHVTAAEPDPDALTYAPAEVRDALARL